MACRSHGLDLIAGVEVSAEVMGSEVHLLVYGFDCEHDGLNELLLRQREYRRIRFDRFLENFRGAGIPVAALPATVLESGESIGRPHLADLLVRHGAAQSLQDAFDRFLVEGADTFVAKMLPDGSEVISVAAAASGICVLAHPGHYTSNQEINCLIEAGLSGIEVVHPSHDQPLVDYYRELADRYGLLKTGGSDYHGRREQEDENLGRYFVSADELGDIAVLRTL